MAITVGQAKAQLAAIEAALSDGAGLKAKVEASFKQMDKNNSNTLDRHEARALIDQLCGIMSLPKPTDADYEQHQKLLDASGDGELDLNEVGSGIVGALMHKAGSLKHFLGFAERDKLSDDKPLPAQ